MHKDAFAARAVLSELADRFEKGQALDVADGAADFAQHEVDLIIADGNEVFDLIGDMRNHLDGFARGSRRAAPSPTRSSKSVLRIHCRSCAPIPR